MCGISDDELTERFKASIRIDNEIKSIKGYPISGYDVTPERPILNILTEGASMSEKCPEIIVFAEPNRLCKSSESVTGLT